MTAMHRGALAMALAWALAAPPCLGDELAPGEWTYRISQSGEVAGFQHLQVLERGSRLLLTTDARLAYRDGTRWQARETAELDVASQEPLHCRLEQVDGRVHSATDAVFADQVVALTHQVRASRWTEGIEYDVRPLLFDSRMLADYLVLSRHYDTIKGGEQRFRVLDANPRSLFTLRLRPPTRAQARAGWSLTGVLATGREALIALEPYTRRLLKVEIPDYGFAAELVPGTMPSVGFPRLPAPRDVWLAPLPTDFAEQEVRFPSGSGASLTGTLSFPAQRPLGPLPAVLLVQSGDCGTRDLALGPNHPYAELAAHLSAAGYAALRYDGRCLQAMPGAPIPPAPTAPAGDARAALSFLGGRAEIDSRRIFWLVMPPAPGLAVPDSGLAGLILMGGPGAASGALASLSYPFLILQGNEDYESPPAVAEKLASAIRSAGNRDVLVRRFAGLNHYLDPVDGPSTGEDYMIPARLAPEAVRVLLQWLKAHTG